MQIDKDLHYTVTFTSKDGQTTFTGEVRQWQQVNENWLCLVKWPKRQVLTLDKNYQERLVTKEPESTWIKPDLQGFTLTANDNIYNLAIKAIKDGIKPGEQKVIWQSKDTKIAVTRSKTQERINLSFPLNPGIKQFEIAVWGKDDTRQSGGGKWHFAKWQDYLAWTNISTK